MKKVCIMLRRPPYGTVDAAEAVRHALGGVVEEAETSLILTDGGVQAARKGQEAEGTVYQSIGAGVADCIEMGARVLADEGSLREAGLGPDDLIPGVIVAKGSEIAETLRAANALMIF